MTNKKLFQIIDFDRTIFDTSKFALLVTAELEAIRPGMGKSLDDRFEAAYKNRETFFVFRYIREEIGLDGLEGLIETVINREGVDALLMPGARERLAFAEQIGTQQPAWGILTYGDADDQYMKLRIAGFKDVPTILLETPDKSEIIATWKNDDGTFTLPAEFGGHTVDVISLEDDKLRAFNNIVEGITGVWMKNPLNELAEGETIPEEVHPVNDMYESIEYLKSLYG